MADDRRGLHVRFRDFHQLENAYLPFNRNGVMFPRKINGNFAMLSRPSDNGHTPFGDIFYSESPDMCFWGKHRHVMSPAALRIALGSVRRSVRALSLSRLPKAGY